MSDTKQTQPKELDPRPEALAPGSIKEAEAPPPPQPGAARAELQKLGGDSAAPTGPTGAPPSRDPGPDPGPQTSPSPGETGPTTGDPGRVAAEPRREAATGGARAPLTEDHVRTLTDAKTQRGLSEADKAFLLRIMRGEAERPKKGSKAWRRYKSLRNRLNRWRDAWEARRTREAVAKVEQRAEEARQEAQAQNAAQAYAGLTGAEPWKVFQLLVQLAAHGLGMRELELLAPTDAEIGPGAGMTLAEPTRDALLNHPRVAAWFAGSATAEARLVAAAVVVFAPKVFAIMAVREERARRAREGNAGTGPTPAELN